MGSCFSTDKKIREGNPLTDRSCKLNSKEKQYLTLIYEDLVSRNKSKFLTQHDFSLFFELTGLWSGKLFKYFDVNGQQQIGLQQFLNGIAKMIRTPIEDKTKILFNFIKANTDQGISYKQFLKMLYHYSKQQLKQIMTNDGMFVHQSIIPSSQQLQKQKQNDVVHIKHEPSFRQLLAVNQKTQFQKAYQKIYQSYQDPGTLLQFKTQKATYQVSYCNMGSLTKAYASHVFGKYQINESKGFMSQSQFKSYVNGNIKLFQTYFSVFHQKLWGYINQKPMFLDYIQKQSHIQLNSNGINKSAYMMLAINTLIFSTGSKTKSDVFRMVYLSEIVIHQNDINKMIIKDQSENNISIQIQFQSQLETKNWLQQLQPYTNNYFKNKYQILQQIGTGRFSIVFRCRQRQSGKQYALKVLQLDKLLQKQKLAIQNQTQIMKILKSHQFVKQYQTIFTKKTLYIISEYVYGEDLFEYVRRKKRLSQHEAAFLLGLIIQAVGHLHNIQIIHRDLKPENIMISYRKSQKNLQECSPNKIAKPKPQMIKIIDFGFANYYSVLQQKSEGTPVGTLGYMAPQILLGEKPSFQNDTFAIGCILYYMLRGKYAFSSNDPEGPALLTVRGQYSLYDNIWEQISNEAKDLIEQLLKTDPLQRITLKQALNHPWFSTIKNLTYQ